MDRSAFSRAQDYLNYSSRAKWIALIAGAGTAFFFVLLLLHFALLIDLLVTRGRVPNFAQLNVTEQERVLDEWRALSLDSRVEALTQLGFSDLDASSKVAPSHKAEDKARFAMWSSLKDADNSPPLPAKINSDDLKKWSQSRPPSDEQPYIQAMKENEIRWRAYVWHFLKDRVSAEAAATLQPKLSPSDPLPLPGLGESNREAHGVLGMVIRLRGTFAGRVLDDLAAIGPWTWDNRGGKDPNRTYLTGLLLISIILAFLTAACMIIMNLQAGRAAVEAVLRLRRSVYHQAAKLGEQSSQLNGSPEASSLFTRQIESIHEALYLWLTTVSRYPAQIILLLALALAVQPWLAMAIVLFALLVWIMGGQIVAAFRRQGRASARQAANRLVLMLESIKLTRLVKSYLMDLFNQSRVERQLSDYTKANMLRYRGEAYARPIMFLLIALAAITLLYLSSRIVLTEGLSLAGLSMLIVAVVGLFPPIRGYLEMRGRLRRGRESAAILFEYLDRREEKSPIPDAEFLQPMAKALEFKGVSWKEPSSGRLVLENVNLHVKAGERIGIMGPSEEEKQVFVSMLSRFADPSEGEVRIDGRNIRWVTDESLRAQIGAVMQSHLVFNDTVANNIGCGDPGINLPRIIEAAKVAHAHQFIQKFPYGYETMIGDAGHSLRIGEQFRIALARAIVRDPALFVIEEPPTALDDDTKTLLDDTFNRVLAGKTVFFLPHRISTLRRCDRIILINNGTIEAMGEHRELVHASPLYKHLYYLEFNQFAEQT